MIYILLTAGIILTIAGLMGLRPERGNSSPGNEAPQSSMGNFGDMLSGTMILRKLDEIEEKIEALGSDTGGRIDEVSNYEVRDTQINIRKETMSDVNRQIFAMKNDGMDVEEIADRIGMRKGEVLLRLGLKK